MASKKNTSAITLSFPNPSEALLETVASIKEAGLTLFDEFISSTRQERISKNKIFSSIKIPQIPQFKFNKKNLPKILLPIVLILVGIVLIKIFLSPPANFGKINGVNTVISDTKPLATKEINREFNFPLKDQKGKEVGKLSYTLESAELRKQIIVKGKRATAIEGRVFLIINLKVVNTLNQGMEVNSRDYIRVSVNGKSNELFAPDIHNDPVEVQAISTKNTRVGLTINEIDKKINIQVGEINGKKTTIPLEFR